MRWEAIVLLVPLILSAIAYLFGIANGLTVELRPFGSFVFLLFCGFEIYCLLRLAGVL